MPLRIVSPKASEELCRGLRVVPVVAGRVGGDSVVGDESGDDLRDEKGERGRAHENQEVELGGGVVEVGVGGHVSDTVVAELILPADPGLLSSSTGTVRNAEGNMFGWLLAGTNLLGLVDLEDDADFA